MEKNLAKKIEKGCLRCGFGLSGVAGSIGLFGAVAINIWKPAALKAAIAKAITEGTADIAAAGVKAGEVTGKVLVISGLKRMGISTLDGKDLGTYFATTSYKNITNITQAVSSEYVQKCISASSGSVRFRLVDAQRDIHFCHSVWKQTSAVSTPKKGISYKEVIERTVETMVSKAEGPANTAAEIAEAANKLAIEEAQEKVMEATIYNWYTTIVKRLTT
ncbi:hypothetical protein PFNF54_05934 [Plasmodium falciparum NF54]|uniref:Rifin n=1 Tax=Plasmodium falciparum (isolate NF54) TaxID=5843 RepID=W7JK82_PLAFO|nr:hypothetical protein PFNF54_05934 [Plasmodium falciparum NF54]